MPSGKCGVVPCCGSSIDGSGMALRFRPLAGVSAPAASALENANCLYASPHLRHCKPEILYKMCKMIADQKPRRRVGRPRIEEPHPVDVLVGQRMRERRLILGLSQERLAEACGVSFQQVQKYERGQNRLSASRLYRVAQILGVPISYFFEDADEAAAGQPMPNISDLPIDDPEIDELARVYHQISDPTVRRRFREMVAAISKTEAA
jgi:transcriptional regulator with XRE-family HTH domain